jgi:hypothetical protein
VTALLETALEKLKALPQDQQDAIASQILDTLSDEEAWTQRFANKDKLQGLAAEALDEYRRGEIQPLDDLL